MSLVAQDDVFYGLKRIEPQLSALSMNSVSISEVKTKLSRQEMNQFVPTDHFVGEYQHTAAETYHQHWGGRFHPPCDKKHRL